MGPDRLMRCRGNAGCIALGRDAYPGKVGIGSVP